MQTKNITVSVIFKSNASEEELIENIFKTNINLRDFSNVDTGKIDIMSPTEFANKYL